MKYYSEKTKSVYDTVEALQTAEKEFDEKEAEKLKLAEVKKTRAKEVENAYAEYQDVKEKACKEIAEAEDKYIKLRDAFAKDYNGYHMTYVNDNGVKSISFGDIVSNLFDW